MTERRKPRVAGKRGPLRSMYMPTKGARKLGRTKARNIRPAPMEFQPNSLDTRRGRVASQLVINKACTRVHQRAESRRREERRVRAGGIVRFLLVEGCCTDEAAAAAAAAAFFSSSSSPLPPGGFCDSNSVNADRWVEV